jgi:putative N6-adenine-specific DNA methylase
MKELFVTCPHGFEPILQKELQSLGVSHVFTGFCGVCIPKTLQNVFIVNYCSRIATRVLWPIATFRCGGRDDLYNHSKRIDWTQYLNCETTFAIDANVQHPMLKNSLFAALVVKDAICDSLREKTGSRPSIDKHHPDVQLNLFIQKGMAHLYLDTSGAPLHKRGWRKTNTEATLHETLAAALLLQTGYSSDKTLCDPFCGSGTFLIEAAMIATRTPAGFFRKKWGFFSLPGFNRNAWLQWKQEKDSQIIPLLKGKIFGSDKSREASEICKQHLQKTSFGSSIEVHYDEISYYKPKIKPDYVITNPPYGKRIETSDKLYKEIGDFLVNHCSPDVKAHILCTDVPPIDSISKTVSGSLSFKNGGLPVSLHSFS